jgi:hypothetical protein
MLFVSSTSKLLITIGNKAANNVHLFSLDVLTAAPYLKYTGGIPFRLNMDMMTNENYFVRLISTGVN